VGLFPVKSSVPDIFTSYTYRATAPEENC
jgi:hypothetical protein